MVFRIGFLTALIALSGCGLASDVTSEELKNSQGSELQNQCRNDTLALYKNFIQENQTGGLFNRAVVYDSKNQGRVVPGRDLLGTGQGSNMLTTRSFSRACRNDETDQLILYIRARELGQSGSGLFDDATRNEVTRLLISAAKSVQTGNRVSDCAANGPPEDYYCPAGLPEAAEYLLNIKLLEDSSKEVRDWHCDVETTRLAHMVIDADLVTNHNSIHGNAYLHEYLNRCES